MACPLGEIETGVAHEEEGSKSERDQQETEASRQEGKSSGAPALPPWERELLAATLIEWLDAALMGENDSDGDE